MGASRCGSEFEDGLGWTMGMSLIYDVRVSFVPGICVCVVLCSRV